MIDAQQNIVTDLETALANYVEQQINRYVGTHGTVALTGTNRIEFTVHSTSTLDLFQLFSLTSAIPPVALSLESVAYTIDTSELVVATRSYGSQTIILDVLDLQNVSLSFSVGLRDVSMLVVNFKGNVDAGWSNNCS